MDGDYNVCIIIGAWTDVKGTLHRGVIFIGFIVISYSFIYFGNYIYPFIFAI